jgi:hypothetical protein
MYKGLKFSWPQCTPELSDVQLLANQALSPANRQVPGKRRYRKFGVLVPQTFSIPSIAENQNGAAKGGAYLAFFRLGAIC